MRAHEQGNEKRQAALKVVLDCDASYPEFAATEKLGQHPNIVEIYEYGLIGKDAVVISEWVEFGTLRDYIEHHRISGRPIHPKIGKQFYLEIVRGLHYIHSKGIQHNDLHSANVFLTIPPESPTGGHAVAKIADFEGRFYQKDSYSLCSLFTDLIIKQQQGVKDKGRGRVYLGICIEKWDTAKILADPWLQPVQVIDPAKTEI